jgi:hypothetical protein
MEPEVPCSQEPTTGRCPKPAETSEYADIQYIYVFWMATADRCRGRFRTGKRLDYGSRRYLLQRILDLVQRSQKRNVRRKSN